MASAVSMQEGRRSFFHGEKEMSSASFMDGGLHHATPSPTTGRRIQKLLSGSPSMSGRCCKEEMCRESEGHRGCTGWWHVVLREQVEHSESRMGVFNGCSPVNVPLPGGLACSEAAFSATVEYMTARLRLVARLYPGASWGCWVAPAAGDNWSTGALLSWLRLGHTWARAAPPLPYPMAVPWISPSPWLD